MACYSYTSIIALDQDYQATVAKVDLAGWPDYTVRVPGPMAASQRLSVVSLLHSTAHDAQPAG